ncbi:MAG TPA: fimbria/pilus periplasmic chaperone [Terracidiphilus sp.]|nr:fimbria/pilus periplasmic chaperone [Terracidiphilus sp.]
MISRFSKFVVCALAAIPAVFMTAPPARAQALQVLPVNVQMAPGQQAATVTVSNQGDTQTAVQIRAYKWDQKGDSDELAPSNDVVVSPPISTIAPGSSQVVRLILRQPPQGHEETYRIILDQIPPPAEPGVVHVVLRMSIPIFAQPTSRAAADVQFHVEVKDGKTYLVGVNDGQRHEAIRGIELKTCDGRTLKVESGASPYILAGTTRHWKIDAPDAAPLPNGTAQLSAHSDAGAINQQVQVGSSL